MRGRDKGCSELFSGGDQRVVSADLCLHNDVK